MSVKFVSKSSNLMVVLRSGIEGNRALGTQMKPGLYARFQGGMIDVKDETMIQLLREHPSFGSDFIEITETAADPYEDMRDEIEPIHVMHEMKYGHVEKIKNLGPQRKLKLSPEMKGLIESEAIKMLPGLLKSNPSILKDILTGLVAEEDKKAQVKEEIIEGDTPAKRGPGRPPKTE